MLSQIAILLIIYYIGKQKITKKEVKKMKKLISALLSVLMILSAFSSVAYAAVPDSIGEEISPMYESSNTLTSILTFSGKTAKCKSTLLLNANETWVSITQTLQKKTSSGTWQAVSGASWTVTSNNNSYYYTFNNSKTVTASGSYRLKSVFVINTVYGNKETITKYSPTATI